MECISLTSGQAIPRFGLGTWRMGESRASRSQEIKALRHGMDAGITLIDTAEMYGEGGAETVMAEVIRPRRAELYIVSKVYPHNASRKGVLAACDRSLTRLKTDYLDLYLLHWKGAYPLAETLEAFHELKQAGKIRDFGVSNFDCEDMKQAIALPYGNEIAVNQVLYNLSRRGIEWDLLPWCQEQQIPVMAYSPLEQGRILHNQTLNAIAQNRQATPAQIAIAWVLRQPEVIAIPKSSSVQRIDENLAALEIQLTTQEIEQLDQAFPAPSRSMPLAVL